MLFSSYRGARQIRVEKERIRMKDLRLDKFLKVSRLIKRRTVANEACDAGRVMVNGKPAKAAQTFQLFQTWLQPLALLQIS